MKKLKNVFLAGSIHDVQASEIIFRLKSLGGQFECNFTETRIGPNLAVVYSEETIREMRKSSGVIVFLDEPFGYSQFEVGSAFAMSKPLLIIARSFESIPLNLRTFRVLVYEHSSSELIHSILQWIRELTPVKDAPTLPLKDMLNMLNETPEDFDKIPAKDFENAVIDMLRERNVSITLPHSPADSGYDFILEFPEDNTRWMAEIKKMTTNSRVSIQHVQQIVGAATVERVAGALIISPQRFTNSAIIFAHKCSLPVRLIGHQSLRGIMDGNLKSLLKIGVFEN